jgi:hypothetical protein
MKTRLVIKPGRRGTRKLKPRPKTRVCVRIRSLRWTKKEKLQDSGVHWDKEKQVWRMRYETALELGLTKQIVEG